VDAGGQERVEEAGGIADDHVARPAELLGRVGVVALDPYARQLFRVAEQAGDGLGARDERVVGVVE
jgi:hypothetical protein